jgi:hypothetical protein
MDGYVHIVPQFARLIAGWEVELDRYRSGEEDYFFREEKIVTLRDDEACVLAQMVALAIPEAKIRFLCINWLTHCEVTLVVMLSRG